MTPGARPVLLGAARAAIGVGVLIYLARSGALDWSGLWGLAVAWPLTLAALALLLASSLLVAWRLCVLLGARGLRLTVASSFRLTMMGNFFSTILPGSMGGDFVRLYYAAKGNEGRRTEVATILLVDRATGFLAMLMWLALVIPPIAHLTDLPPGLRGGLWTVAASATLALMSVPIVSTGWVGNSRLVRRAIRTRPLGPYVEVVLETLGVYGPMSWRMLSALSVSFLSHTVVIAVILILLRATNPGGFMWGMAVLIPIGLLANALPLTPGGLGVGEAALEHLFILGQFSGGAEGLLAWRLLTALVDLLGLAFYLRGGARFVHQPGLPARSGSRSPDECGIP